MAFSEFELREARVKLIFADAGALIVDSHIVYTSGRHGTAYINKDAIYPYTLKTRELCQMMADDFKDQGVQTVVGPAYGGIILANNIAAVLTLLTGNEVAGVFAEKTPDGGFTFNRGYAEFVKDRRVLITEDILTTGGSATKVIYLCREVGAEVVGLAVLANRGGVKSQDVGNVDLRALLNINMESYPEGECQLCKDEVPINTIVGKGAEFLRRKVGLI